MSSQVWLPNYENICPIYNEHMRHYQYATTIGLNTAQQLYQDCYHGSLLEIGCGNGSFAITLLRGGLVDSAVLLDMADICIEYVKQGLEIWSVKAECIRAAFEEYETTDTFDTIVFWEGLEHIADLNLFCSKVTTLMKQDGVFIGSVPDGYTCNHETHLQHFSLSGLVKCLSNYFGRLNVQSIDLNSKGEIHLVYKAQLS